MGKFSRAPRHLGAPTSLKNTEKGVPDGFFLTSNMHKIIFGQGSSQTRCGSYGAPQTSSRMVKGHPSPSFLPSASDVGTYRMSSAISCLTERS